MNEDLQLTLFDNSLSERKQDTQIDKALSLMGLNGISGVGFSTIKRIFNNCKGDPSCIWDSSQDELLYHLRNLPAINIPQLIQEIILNKKQLLEKANEKLQALEKDSISIIFRDTSEYPVSLNDLPDPPEWLFIQGNRAILNTNKGVAVVGTRTPSPKGLKAAQKLAMSLVKNKCVIISGLAEGIDAKAHEVSVDYGLPTISVVGHGIKVIYPSSTSYLRERIIDQGGAVISEYLPDDMYSKEKFIKRNRLQAALASLVAIIEGKSKSGTSHTVNFARNLKRPIFGVTIGGITNIEQHEILQDIQKLGFNIFNLDLVKDCEILKNYVNKSVEKTNEDIILPEPYIFGGVVNDIRRIMKSYAPKDSDITKLISNIEDLAKGKKNAN